MDRTELGAFLRSRRGRIRPEDAGLVAGGRRQTPGLRRDEVALLAGISVDYYIRLEQGRGPHPSAQVLRALGRALRVNEDEQEYLFRLVEGSRVASSREVPPNVLRLLERLGDLGDVPAMVVNGCFDVLAWNRMLVALIGDPAETPVERRNTLRWLFGGELAGTELARQCVADLRASGLYSDDAGVRRLVDELSASSPRFAEVWSAREVEVRHTITKRSVHPVVGELELDCEILPVHGRDQRIILYTAEPGTASHRALKLLGESLPI
ncbi:helix-turn-helix domain-containing protein [Actinomadura barringtoniae]|uniref:Helix-turn-helix domain-containing protein n=1 Tax=Actinomadura barringtoniae TaxID=1427535 RepID=A0A939T620_9ACTN|nr:helix-turn-helix transcriptional regulator [Actinomadura barringtoniae]MBO2454416.1 helix-turn-helix domain-containing protein [Actinomadura barringtoniae]